MESKWFNGKLSTVVLFLGILGNAVYFGMEVGQTKERISQVEKRQKDVEDIRERVTRVEELSKLTKESVERVERKLDKLTDQMLRERR